MRALIVSCTAACALLTTGCTCGEHDAPRARPAPPSTSRPTPTRASASDAGPRAVVVPPLFGALFEKGRAWTHDYAYEYPDHVPFSGTTTMRLDGTIRCQVAQVRALGQAMVSRMDCDLFDQGAETTGEGDEPYYPMGDDVYIANERGLWIGDPEACKALSAACVGALKRPPYLASSPRAGRREQHKGKDVTTVEVQPQVIQIGEVSAKAWCRKLTQLEKRERYQEERCFAPGRGLVKMSTSLKKLDVAHPDEEAATGDPSWSNGSLTQTGEWKPPPKTRPAPTTDR